MGHYHLEIIMPPTDDVRASVKEILAPFDENMSSYEGHSTCHAFWDWYVIGGRWSGCKMMHKLGAARIAAFRADLNARKITISGLQMGKPTLQPATQRAEVDRLWAAAFPEAPPTCPLFDYFTDDVSDIIRFADAPRDLTCARVIIAGPDWENEKTEAQHMLSDSIWNGVTHQDAKWTGTIGEALIEWSTHLKYARDERRLSQTPTDDWLVVTVDYHS